MFIEDTISTKLQWKCPRGMSWCWQFSAYNVTV